MIMKCKMFQTKVLQNNTWVVDDGLETRINNLLSTHPTILLNSIRLVSCGDVLIVFYEV